jgi:hypothetical protein
MNDYKRRVRIEHKPFEHNGSGKKPVGYMTTVHDADTGEEITNITDVVVYLRVNGINEAAITYYEEDNTKRPTKNTAMSANPDVDVLAMERDSWLETMVFQALGEASMCWGERPRGVFQGQEAKRIGNELIAEITRHYRTN